LFSSGSFIGGLSNQSGIPTLAGGPFLKRCDTTIKRRSTPTLDRESIASHYMDIHRNPRTSKWISIKSWIIEE